MNQIEKVFDAREIPMIKRIGTVLQAIEALNAGDILILVNDMDPRPLKLKLGNRYEWEYLEQGPDVFRVKITRR